MPLKKTISKPWAGWIGGALLCAFALLFAQAVWAAPCDLRSNPPEFISNDLTNSYCELCGYGYVTVVISNPYEEVDMVGMTVAEDLRDSGLSFAPSAPAPVTYRVNGGFQQVGGAPVLSGTNDSILTWTSAQIPALNRLAYDPLPLFPPYTAITDITIRFAVTRDNNVNQEGLVGADRRIQARLTYDTDGADDCVPGATTVLTGLDTLPLREPYPQVSKRGRNVDADQDSWQYSQSVYGNLYDDVIWRIRVRNTGQADLQDLRFDDLMQTGNVEINYACPTEASASAVAANNGVDPGGTGCVPAGNTINNFDVDNPFGNPGNDSPDLVDVRDGNSGYIYLVGKIPAAPNGSCSTNRTNTVSDIQWGCQADAPAGGITTTSTGYTPGNASATLSSLSVNTGSNLSVQTEFVGSNTSQPAGSKGRVRITIRNNTGGTVKGIRLRNILPSEYVVDPTFTPTLAATGAYGAYAGMTDRIQWTNPAAGTFPLTTSDPAVALSNTAPEFRLYSSTTHPIYPDQIDMLRHGDRLVVTFGVVLIRPQSYDKVANLDVRSEAPNSDPAGTDPDNAIQVNNRLYVEFEDFCAPGIRKNPPTNPLVTTHQTDPEDLDINIAGNELIFILTGDPNQRLPLTVNLTNNGGHDAANYAAYISFGQTMDVVDVTVPSGWVCTPTGNPPSHEVWRSPAFIPPNATVYRCTGPAIEPGETGALTFQVLKSTDPADLAADDLTFRADVVGEITLSDTLETPLWFPTPVNPRGDGGTDDANNYSLDGIRARVVGFNLLKSQVGTCSENNPPPFSPDRQVQIGEECSYHIDTGGWFGFQTPGFTYIAVQDIRVVDQLPDGQGYISSTDPLPPTGSSTSAITGVSLNPGGLSAVDEGWIDWTFNQVVPAERITQRDHWFRVDMTSRLLNDPIDESAAPNSHAAQSTNILNSYFQAVFYNPIVMQEETYDLGPNTVGYPRLEVRRIALTVTEPKISVVKEVCNESLYGAGPGCSNFVPLADDGDAYNAYIYRLTLTNQASSSGVQRAPAYDVTVTDRLDASDLAYVLPFNEDGLDNDGDSTADEAGPISEGTISDNTVNNAAPAQITFAHTHSSALQRIDPGQSVQLYYRVDFDDDAAPLQTFTNTADTTYDTLTGDSGNQSTPQRPNSDSGGARVYTSPSDSAAVQIIPVETQPKCIVNLSNTPLVPGPATQPVSIGEEIGYRLDTLLPVALLRNFVIRDELPAGLRCSEAPVVDLGAPPYAAANFVPGGVITPSCTDNLVQWDFGDQRVTTGTAGNRFDFEVGFIARVENSAATNDGDLISNGQPATQATARYINELGNPVSLDFSRVDVQVREPRIELTKVFAVANADAGDILTVTVTADNSGTAIAYNLRVLDDLTGRNLTFVGNVGGANPPDTIDTTTLGANRPIFSWNPPNGIDPGAEVSFTFEVRVDTVAQPQEVLDNTIQAQWTSLPGQTTALNSSGRIGADGSETGMRIGALPNAGDAVNDYESVADNAVSVPPATMTKTDLDPTAIPAIGLHKNFQLEIHLPEGTTHDVLVTDSLDAAGVSYLLANNAGFDITYTFAGIATINGQAPGEAAFNAFPADSTGGSVVWDIGTVVTETENDPGQTAIDPLIRIHYYARVNNDLVTDSGDTLQNGVVLNYTHGESGGQETLIDAAALVTAVEPVLAATKTVSNVTPGKQPADPPSGGDLLEYVVAVLNSGNSTAHDVNLVDTLPSNLALHTGFTPTALINGVAVAGFATDPANAPTGPLVWGRDNSDGSLDIPVGQSLVLTYRAVVQVAGGDISNSILIDWTSLDGASGFERTGDGCPNWTAPNDYCSGPAVAVTTTVDTNSIDKTVSADTFDTAPWSTAGDAVARVGDLITYRLALNLSGGLTRNVRVQDTLPGGMAFVDTIQINGDTTASFTSSSTGTGSNFAYAAITSANVPAAGQTGVLTWAIGDVVNDPFGDPTSDTLEIVYLARILPDAGIAHLANTTLTNSVNMDYATAVGPALTQTDSATITVVQPILTVAKSAVAAGGDTVLTADEVVTYTVDILNSGSAPAYDTQLRDIIPLGMRNGSATITPVSIQLLSGSVLPNLTPAYDPSTGVAVWNLDSGVADQYAIPAGDTLRIVYELQTDEDMGAGLTLTNQAQVQLYDSLDDEDIPSQGGFNGEPQVYGPSNITSVTFTTATPDALIKDNPGVLTVAVGQPFAYRITIPATPHDTALHDVRILDDLGASAAELVFVSAAKVSGSQTWTPVNTGTPTNLVIEDTISGIDIPAGEQIVIDITVVLDNTATNVSGLQFNNTADYTYNQIGDNPATQSPGGSDTTDNMTIVGADTLTFEKSGPPVVQMGIPATYTLNMHNTSTGTVWNPILSDFLPNQATGGMCAVGPSNVSAQIFLGDGVTPASPPLVEGTDFTVAFDSAPSCQWRFILLSPAGGVPSDRRLILNYNVELDPSTENGISLTNIAGATRWYSADPEVAGAAPRIFDQALTDGTPAVLDHEDAHTITTQTPILTFLKSVQNVTTGQDPGSSASPGDTLRYTIGIANSGPVGLTNFSIMDEVDHLNSIPAFAAGTLNPISVPPGADTSGSDAMGGTFGTGLLDIANLNIGAQGDPDDTIVIVFEITLAPVMTSGTLVLNQAELLFGSSGQFLSDDPNIAGDSDPTETLISSAPVFEVQKVSTIMSGDPNVLMAGETLRYTITIRNIGNEDAVDVRLRDYTPANTIFVSNSTSLNGSPVPDPSPGENPLQAGLLINTPLNSTPGFMPADPASGATTVATVSFDVEVDPTAMDSLVIENQGFVSGSGQGSGLQPEQPSDDPSTPIPDDPTCNVVGNLPLLYAHKTVALYEDFGSPGIVDPGDALRYTIEISNFSAIPATDVVLTDGVPTNTAYIADSLRLNGASMGPDGGLSPLIAGLPVQSADNSGAGTISAGTSGVITFNARVNAGVPTGTLISNQGSVTSNELPPEPTDADGLPSNGDQPTIVVVGDVQMLTITKQVAVVGGGPATAGGQLEYAIRVTNIGSLPATNVVIRDDFSPPLGNQVAYVAGSATLNGATGGVSYSAPLLSAEYGGQYGDLPPGASAVVRFRVQISSDLAIGTTITNTADVRWNTPQQAESASVSIDVGGTPGSAGLNGNVWHDANLDKLNDGRELPLQGWSVELYSNNRLVTTVLTDADGAYQLTGLVPSQGTAQIYELRFSEPGAGPNTATLGYADSLFTNGPHRISAISAASGSNLQHLNLPISPNGAVYNSVVRVPVAGARLALVNAASGESLPDRCFDDPLQQNQLTGPTGFYKFDLNFSDAACPAGGAYLIEVTSPATGYLAAPSRIIPPASDATTAAFSIPACPGSAADALPATATYCEVAPIATVPPLSAPPRTDGTLYHLHLLLSDGDVPGQSQIFNNPIPVDPQLDGAVAITKTTPQINVTRGSLVPYSITVTNVLGVPLYDISIVDRFPAGFKYVGGSARLDGNAAEPLINGRELIWDDLELQVNQKYTLELLLVVGSGVSEGEYVNSAYVRNDATGTAVSGEATATVQVIPDPDFNCTDVIGKVFDDRNLNGQQDKGEKGLAGVRLVTVRGLIVTSDQHGRFHITCAMVPEEDRGSNFILKLDERSLPAGYRLTTENPRVLRATRGKMIRFKFGATIHRVVRLDFADGVFEPDTSTLRPQWVPRIEQLLEELKKAPSVLRLSYLADVEGKGLVEKRLDALKKMITSQWEQSDGGYRLVVETEIFWRRGAPIAGR